MIDVMLQGIITDEGFALELAEMATLAEQGRNPAFAEAARTIGRHHRVKAMELRAQLAVLSVEYSHVLNEDD